MMVGRRCHQCGAGVDGVRLAEENGRPDCSQKVTPPLKTKSSPAARRMPREGGAAPGVIWTR
jgi:hypothetical protein